MTALLKLNQTTIGLKALMAGSGLLLTGWTLLHVAGNLTVFAGPATMNGYAAALHGSPVLWAQRIAVIGLTALHVWAAWLVRRRARAARPERYVHGRRCGGLAARAMALSGVAVAAFVVLHAAQLYGPLHADFRPDDVWHNLTAGLRHPAVALGYAAATGLFGLHLSHGLQSLLRSLGASGTPWDDRLAQVARLTAAGLTLGFLAIPGAALAGWWGYP